MYKVGDRVLDISPFQNGMGVIAELPGCNSVFPNHYRVKHDDGPFGLYLPNQLKLVIEKNLSPAAEILGQKIEELKTEVVKIQENLDETLKQVEVAKEQIQNKLDEIKELENAIKYLEKQSGSKNKKTK